MTNTPAKTGLARTVTCRRTPDDRDQVAVRGRHVDPLPQRHDPDCRGCLPCPVDTRRHCSVCTCHLEVTELQTCSDCLGKTRRHLHEIVDLATLLPGHALHAAHDGRLLAANHHLFPGGEALAMMARGSEGLSDAEVSRADEALPPGYVLAFWEEIWRTVMGLSSKRPPWQRRPARAMIEAQAFLSEHLGWAAAHHPGFHQFARDLAATRTHLEELLHAGDAPAEGVPCFECGATLIREYRNPRPCKCGPPPPPRVHCAHHRTDVCCLGCAAQVRWELGHQGHDQGGRDDGNRVAGWHCPRCRHEYTPGEYDLALRTDYQEVAEYLPLADCIDLTGAKRGSISAWASGAEPKVRKRRDLNTCRMTYHVNDIKARLAAIAGRPAPAHNDALAFGPEDSAHRDGVPSHVREVTP